MLVNVKEETVSCVYWVLKEKLIRVLIEVSVSMCKEAWSFIDYECGNTPTLSHTFKLLVEIYYL